MGWKCVNFGVFSRLWSKFDLEKLPALPGPTWRGPKNRFLGFPATKKVLARLLKCPKTTHKHYGILPWGPWSTMGPSKSNFANCTLFQQNLPYCPNCCKTVLRGPKNWFVGVPAREKVIESLLWGPKGPHNHYGTIPLGARGTLGPTESKIFQISPQRSQKPISRVPSNQKSVWTPSKVSQDNTQTLSGPTLGSPNP